MMRVLLISIALAAAADTAMAQAAPTDTASTGASYVEGATWTYPSLSDILHNSGHGVSGKLSVDCALRPDGHVEGCSVTPSDDKTDAGQQNAIGAAYQQHAVVDPASIDGGIQPGDRVRFKYDFYNLPASDIAGASTLPLLDPTHAIAFGKWSYPNAGVMSDRYPSAAANRNISGTVEIVCYAAADGSLTSCQLLAEDPSGYGFGQVTSDLFAKYTRVDPASVDGGIPNGAWHLFTYKWTTR